MRSSYLVCFPCEQIISTEFLAIIRDGVTAFLEEGHEIYASGGEKWTLEEIDLALEKYAPIAPIILAAVASTMAASKIRCVKNWYEVVDHPAMDIRTLMLQVPLVRS